jgi:gluconate 5-dehydrogenase
MAIGLGRAGADVAVAARTESAVRDTVEELRRAGRAAVGFRADVRSVESVRALFRSVAEHWSGRLDILIAAAGINVRVPSLEYTEDIWDSIVDTNLKGTFFCCQEAARLMLPRRFGRIVLIGSLATSYGVATMTPYAATKAGVAGMARCLAVEWGPYGITVNGISPGYFETDLNRAVFRKPGWVETVVARTPLGRTGEPDDLSEVAVFLCSDAARYITGQMVAVDGGFLAGWTGGLTE